MSLDLSLVQNTPTNKLASGIFVRENGEIKEIETLKDFNYYFPDEDECDFYKYTSKTLCLWTRNITHNLGKMANHVKVDNTTLYMLLWRPEELGFNEVNEDYKLLINNGLNHLKLYKDELLQYNPENGWGSYDSLLDFTQDYYDALNKVPNGTKIYANR